MLINDLPDDCLLIIFDLFNNLDELINLSQVCSRWNHLISYRLRTVEHLLHSCLSGNDKATVYWENESTIDQIDPSELLPNLKIIELTDSFANFLSYGQTFSQNNQSISGLIYKVSRPIYDDDDCESFAKHFPNLKMISVNWMDPYFKNQEAAIKLEQISLERGYVNLIADIASNLTNLKRLHIYDDECYTDFYEGPMLPGLKILELETTSYGGQSDYIGFHLMDFCPSLESAFMVSDTHYYYVNESIKNENLRDLVLDHLNYDYGQRWDSLRSLLLKFPNLENLLIRKSDGISDQNIEELVNILPKVKLLDLRDAPKVTSKSNDYLRNYCKKSGRSIVLYYNCKVDEPKDWPQIIETNKAIVRGFDFMSHCFFRKFENLPMFLIPNEY